RLFSDGRKSRGVKTAAEKEAEQKANPALPAGWREMMAGPSGAPGPSGSPGANGQVNVTFDNLPKGARVRTDTQGDDVTLASYLGFALGVP
ncbi:MAG: hypothetical protein H7841_17440, partial [Magnetospirillum sp. WYHS-4]